MIIHIENFNWFFKRSHKYTSNDYFDINNFYLLIIPGSEKDKAGNSRKLILIIEIAEKQRLNINKIFDTVQTYNEQSPILIFFRHESKNDTYINFYYWKTDFRYVEVAKFSGQEQTETENISAYRYVAASHANRIDFLVTMLCYKRVSGDSIYYVRFTMNIKLLWFIRSESNYGVTWVLCNGFCLKNYIIGSLCFLDYLECCMSYRFVVIV